MVMKFYIKHYTEDKTFLEILFIKKKILMKSLTVQKILSIKVSPKRALTNNALFDKEFMGWSTLNRSSKANFRDKVL